MARPSLQREDYEELAEKRGLTFVPTYVPTLSRSKAFWKCKYCGGDIFISFHKLRYKSHGCICQNGRRNSIDCYQMLAQRLDIKLDNGGLQPRNIFQKLQWRSPEGEPFEASYHELAYQSIPKRLRKYVQLA